MSFQESKAWNDFEKSDYARKVVAGLDKKAEQADSAKNPDPKSPPSPLENSNWQQSTGEVPLNPEGAGGSSSGTPIKFHNLNETASPIEEVARKQPTGRLAKVLTRMVKIAEAWESSGDEKLQPYVAELDEIIDTAMAEYQTDVQASTSEETKEG